MKYYAAVMTEFGMHETCIRWKMFEVSLNDTLSPLETAEKLFDHNGDMVIGFLPSYLYDTMVKGKESFYPILPA